MRETLRRTSRRQVEYAALESLERLVFSKASFAGLVFHTPDEFVWNGEQYDAKKIANKGNQVIVYAKHDKHETRLVKKFIVWFGEQVQNLPSKDKSHTAKVFQPEFYWSKKDFQSFLNITVFAFKPNYDFTASYTPCCPSPPPDFILAS